MPKLKGRGGPGRGQGRKPDPNKKQPLYIKLTPDLVAHAKGKENTSGYIESLVRKDKMTMPNVNGWTWSAQEIDGRPFAILEKDVEFDLFTFTNTPYWSVPIKVNKIFEIELDHNNARSWNFDPGMTIEDWLDKN